MNRNYLLAAIPFAIISDVAWMVKAFTGYSDNTLTALSIISLVVVAVLILKALGYWRMPSFSGWGSCQAPVREIHHHHYHDDETDEVDDRCGEEDGYTEEELEEAKDEARHEGYQDGWNAGHDAGYDAGYAKRDSEEIAEAEELARLIAKALKLEQEKPAEPGTPAATTVRGQGEDQLA